MGRAGHDHNGDVGADGVDSFGYLVSRHIEHHEIRKDEIELPRVFDESLDALLAALLTVTS